MGPIALFDKSFLQSLSTDEAVWFDHFFYPVICPVFFIETLADLEKPSKRGKTPEEEVGIIAAKTPEMSGGPCHFHHQLAIGDLLGQPVPMTGQIPIAGARSVVKDGKLGAVVEVTPEADALHRWKGGRFLEVERVHARRWRAHLESIDLSGLQVAMNAMGVTPKTCKSLADARTQARQVVDALTKSTGRFAAAMAAMEVPERVRPAVSSRWKAAKKPPLRLFAPYAAHCLEVELFFRIAVGAHLIAATRASNRADIAYLFYLPFCHVFISSDRLHRVCAANFLRRDQTFVWGPQLKEGLRWINEYFLGRDEVRNQALYQFARHLPHGGDGVLYELFAKYTPGLLPGREQIGDTRTASPEQDARLLQHLKGWQDAPRTHRIPLSDREIESLVIERAIQAKRGSWVQIAPEHRG